jgi:winged helix-turn-helix protein DUF2582
MNETLSEIGAAAGSVWQYLNDNGAASGATIAEATGLGKNELQRALGWLAREDNLAIETRRRTEYFSLRR